MRELLDLPANLRKRLAQALETGLLTLPCSQASLSAALGLQGAGDKVATALEELGRSGASGSVVAEWLRTLDEVALRGPRLDLVWSGPEVPGVHARDTRRVYEELLGWARRTIWLSTFAYFDGPRAFELLGRRMNEVPDLRVKLLLNIQRRRGDTTAPADLVMRFATQFWGADWPGKAKPSVFYDPRSLELEGPGGVLHAKALVTDDQAVFITSANMTEAAFDRNFELGILVRDRALALSVASHFRTLIERGLLKPLPVL